MENYTELAVKVEGIDARCKSNEHRIEDLENDMKETKDVQITLVKLANGVENMGAQIMSVKEDIKDVKKGQTELSNKVTDLENRPAKETQKRWNGIWDKIILIFITGLSGWILGQLLPQIF